MTKAEFEAMLEKAGEVGAKKALQSLGLHDDDAPEDLRELRGLLDSWRAARRGAWQTVGKIATTALLVVMGLGIWTFLQRGGVDLTPRH